MYQLAKELAKLKKLGISIHVNFLTEKVIKSAIAAGNFPIQEPEADGFLTATTNKLSFAINVTRTDNTSDIRVVIVGSGPDSPITDLGNQGSDDLPHYIKIVPTEESWQGRTTKPKDNSLRIIIIRNGMFIMFQVAVVTQVDRNGMPRYFLIIQEMYKSEIIFVAGAIATPDFPGYAKWANLQGLVSQMVDPSTLNTKARTIRKKPAPQFKEGEGRVIYFNPVNGTGFVDTKHGAKFLYWNQIETPDRLAYVENGQRGTYAGIQENDQGGQLVCFKPK